MPDYWDRSVRQFGTWAVWLGVYVGLFLLGSVLIGQLTQTDTAFLLYWRAFFFGMIYLPFGAVSVYAMSVAWDVYVQDAAFPDNAFFSSGGPAPSSRFASDTFRQAGTVVDHVRLWFYVLTGPVLIGLTLDDAVATALELAGRLTA